MMFGVPTSCASLGAGVDDFTNAFRVWRLYRGALNAMDDPFFSPAISVVEDEHDESRGD